MESYAATLEQFCNGQYAGPMPSDAQVLNQIAKGINYLHTKGFAHGNLNPQTILISQSQPVRMKVAEFGLKKSIVDFSDSTDGGNSPNFHFQRELNIMEYSGDQDFEHGTQVAPAIFQLNFMVKLIILLLSPIFNFYRLIFGNGAEKSSNDKDKSFPGFWMLANSWSTSKDRDGNDIITLTDATVHGDVFAAGCLFFYYITRGVHPFEDPDGQGSILINIKNKNAASLNSIKLILKIYQYVRH